MKKNKLLPQIVYALIVWLLFAKSALNAQVGTLFNAYSYDPMQLNIAAMGRSCFEANLNSRIQWLGLTDDDLKLFQLNTSMTFGEHIGAGLKVFQQQNGLLKTNNVTAGYCYKLKLNKTAKLHFGLGASWSQVNFNFNKVRVISYDDPELSTTNAPRRSNNFDCEAGVALYDKALTAGLSVNHLYNTNLNSGQGGFINLPELVAYASYTFKIKNDFEFMPWLMNRYVLGGFYTPEVLLNVRYKKMFSAGVGYRYPNGTYVNLCAEVKHYKIVYSFDYNFAKVSKYLGTTHQILLGFDLCKKKNESTPAE